MARLENLPRPGLPNSLGAYMEAFKDTAMPPRFAEYVCAHLAAKFPMHADNQVSTIIGGFALLKATDIRPSLEALNKALTSELPDLTRADYEKLKMGLESLIATKTP